MSTAIPNAPIAIGVTVYTQAIRTSTPLPTIDNYLALPITP